MTPPNREEIEKLRERVRAADAQDRDLDIAIAQTLVPDVIVMRQERGETQAHPYTHWNYTGSIDDALALLWRLWPHANFELSCAASEGSYCLLTMPTDGGEIHLGDAEGNTPCLTILDAVLTALLSGSEA